MAKITKKSARKPQKASQKPFKGRPQESLADLENDFDLENFEIKNSLSQLNQLSKKGKKRTQSVRAREEEKIQQDPVQNDEDEKELELYLQMQEKNGVENSDSEDSESDVDPDQLVPVQFANQTTAILSRLEDMHIPGLEFIDQVSLTSSTITSSLITSVDDDLSRELAFYQQALETAKEARTLILEAGVAFSRPGDYFAEMIKSDEHMVKVREKLLAQESSILESEKAKKQRDLKKFGKQVQVSKLLERQKEKKGVLEKVKGMRRKGVKEDVDFDVQLEEKLSKPSDRSTSKPNFNKKRAGKNAKFGYGGAKRYAKQNTRESTSDLASFSVKKMKSDGGKRVGKKIRK